MKCLKCGTDIKEAKCPECGFVYSRKEYLTVFPLNEKEISGIKNMRGEPETSDIFRGLPNVMASNPLGQMLSDLGGKLVELKTTEMQEYTALGNTAMTMGMTNQALVLYEQALEIGESLYKGDKSREGLLALALCYRNMGNVFSMLMRTGEALRYYKKDLKCLKDYVEVSGNLESWCALAACHQNMGNVLSVLGRGQEALLYYESARISWFTAKNLFNQFENTIGNITSEVVKNYSAMGNACISLGLAGEVSRYYEKALEYAELVHKREKTEESLRELSFCYTNMGNALSSFIRVQDGSGLLLAPYECNVLSSLTLCYEKALKCTEDLYKMNGNKVTQCELAGRYYNLANILKLLGRKEEAVLYLEKVQECIKELKL